MKNIFKSGIFFWVFLGLYLIVREWPTGNTMQTVLDVLVVIVILLTILQMVMKEK
ncbi:hypothetical protein [Desulfuribacillus stibiiarsenatis]|uniref:hypothetical protein n=1 Tax=Desulfuribacillus stibiiarsenatis TaxID=1390249 RepID=UPI00159F2F48|nr:hypothetical protein [Desulfuribacillus stibiiarsenatis]